MFEVLEVVLFAECIYPLGTTVGCLVLWLSTPVGQWSAGSTVYLVLARHALSIATNTVTTSMIAYQLWYVEVGFGSTGFIGSP